MTGFEFLLTPLPINKIKQLTMQTSEKRSRISANPQPHATRAAGDDETANSLYQPLCGAGFYPVWVRKCVHLCGTQIG